MNDEELLAEIEARDACWNDGKQWGQSTMVGDRRALLRMLKEARAATDRWKAAYSGKWEKCLDLDLELHKVIRERDGALDENKWLRIIVNDEFGDDMADVIIARRRERAANPEDDDDN